jgi:hypothetical protein
MHTGRYKRREPKLTYCCWCRKVIVGWPKGGVILENETGTEEKPLHIGCAELFIKNRGARIIGDNVNRG